MRIRSIAGAWLLALIVLVSLAGTFCEAVCLPVSGSAGGAVHACCPAAMAGHATSGAAAHASDCGRLLREQPGVVDSAVSQAAPVALSGVPAAPARLPADLRTAAAQDAASPPCFPLRI